MEENTNYQVTTGRNLPTLKMRLLGKIEALSYQGWCHALYRTVFRRTLLMNLSEWQPTTIWQKMIKRVLQQPKLYAIAKKFNDKREQKLSLKLTYRAYERANFDKF